METPGDIKPRIGGATLNTSQSRSPWLKHGFWNTLEHALTRGADAASTIILLWVLSPEIFSKLALAQALVAPFLFLFISPETVLYRDFAKWEQEGIASLAGRLRSLRLFGWGKGIFAVLISVTLAYCWPGDASGDIASGLTGMAIRFWSVLWAFSLVLAPQICGTDREYLRLSLKLEALNFTTFFQKTTLLGGTALVSIYLPGRIDALGFVAVMAAIISAIVSFCLVRRVLIEKGATSEALKGKLGPSAFGTLRDSLGSFSIWSHLSGMLTNWVQMMDLFFLGAFHLPARIVGLYAAAVKLAGFSLAFPMALSNLFAIWIGRRAESPEREQGEQIKLRKLSFGLMGGVFLQTLIFIALGPYVTSILSHGRWSAAEQSSIFGWLCWLLVGNALWCIPFLLGSWLSVRRKIQDLFFRVSLPWGIISVLIYAVSVYGGGAHFAAIAKTGVAITSLLLLLAMRTKIR